MKTGLLLMIGLSFLFPLFAGDIILYNDGGREDHPDLKVTNETWKEITYEISGQAQKVQTSKVKRVDYSDAPSAYKDGISFFNKGQYQRAIESLTKGMQDRKVRDWIKQYAPFYIGRAYLQLGAVNSSNYREAASTFNDMLRDNPDTRFLMDALIYLGEAYAQNGNYDEAEETFDRVIDKANTEKSFGKEWELKGKLKKCTIFELSQNYDKAISEYKALASSAGRDSTKIANLAKLRVGKCYILQEDYSRARSHFDTLKGSSDEPEVISGSWAGLGFCAFKQEDYDSAYQSYLKYITRYFQSREDGPEVYYNIAECIQKLGDSKVPNAKKARKWYLTRLVEKFPASPKAVQARELLK